MDGPGCQALSHMLWSSEMHCPCSPLPTTNSFSWLFFSFQTESESISFFLPPYPSPFFPSSIINAVTVEQHFVAEHLPACVGCASWPWRAERTKLEQLNLVVGGVLILNILKSLLQTVLLLLLSVILPFNLLHFFHPWEQNICHIIKRAFV